MNKNIKKALQDLELLRDNAYREIDDNPFLTKKITWLDRLFGITKSQAQRAKEKVDARYARGKAQVLLQQKLYKDILDNRRTLRRGMAYYDKSLKLT